MNYKGKMRSTRFTEMKKLMKMCNGNTCLLLSMLCTYCGEQRKVKYKTLRTFSSSAESFRRYTARVFPQDKDLQATLKMFVC